MDLTEKMTEVFDDFMDNIYESVSEKIDTDQIGDRFVESFSREWQSIVTASVTLNDYTAVLEKRLNLFFKNHLKQLIVEIDSKINKFCFKVNDAKRLETIDDLALRIE
jgi:outer membrane PBP1 activator LpoA protein